MPVFIKFLLIGVLFLASLEPKVYASNGNEENFIKFDTTDTPVECQFLVNQSVISCENGLIQCNATMNFTGEGTDKFKIFGLGFVPNQENVELDELVKFYLYPKSDDKYFQNFTIQIGFRFHRFSIYYATSMFDDGFRVTDLKCYSKMVRYFRTQKSDKIIQIKTESSVGVQNTTVFGYISLV